LETLATAHACANTHNPTCTHAHTHTHTHTHTHQAAKAAGRALPTHPGEGRQKFCHFKTVETWAQWHDAGLVPFLLIFFPPEKKNAADAACSLL